MNKFAIFLAAGLLPLCSFGQALSGSNIGYVSNGNGGGNFVKFGAGTTFTNVPSGVPTAFRDLATGSKDLMVRASGAMPLGSAGASVAVAAEGRVTAASLGKAFGALSTLVGGPAGVALMVGTPFILQWLSTSGVTPNSDGSYTSAGPGTTQWSTNYSSFPAAYRGDASSACKYLFPSIPAAWVVTLISGTPETQGVKYGCGGNIYTAYAQITSIRVFSAGLPVPITSAQVETKLATVQPDPYVLSELYNKKVWDLAQIDGITLSGPASTTGTTSTQNTPAQNGQPASSTTTASKYDCAYSGATVNCAKTDTTTKTVTGVDPVTGNPTTTTTTSTATEKIIAPEKQITCGLPDTPVCAVKVDETGMPTSADITTDSASKEYKRIKDFVDNPDSLGKPLPTINWAFALPSSCSVIPMSGAFAEVMPTIDVCQFQPMFHSIMSMVWMLGGLFGAISLFMKSSLGGD